MAVQIPSQEVLSLTSSREFRLKVNQGRRDRMKPEVFEVKSEFKSCEIQSKLNLKSIKTNLGSQSQLFNYHRGVMKPVLTGSERQHLADQREDFTCV